MALPRIFVVDDSEAVRETLLIVLGNVADVRPLSPHECTASFPVPDGSPDLVIANLDAGPPALLRALARSSLPVIWLRPDPTRNAPLRDSAAESVVLPYRFDGHVVAQKVAQLLQQRPKPGHRPLADKLTYPYLPREAALVAREASGNRLPVLIRGEPGTGRARVAAAIGAPGVSRRVVTVTPQSCTRSALENLPTGGSELVLFVDDVDSAGPEAQGLLLEIAESNFLQTPAGRVSIRLITGTGEDLASLAHAGVFSPDLYYRINVLPITLTPLRDRPEDIPPLVQATASDLCSTLGLPPVTFTPHAIQRLRRYLWFGNAAELETVLARTISLVHKQVIDIGDLLFGYGPIAPATGPAALPPEYPSAPLASKAVDLIINELAHEFKNPLVTIKTFAQHLEQLLEEEGGRDQLMRLTGEAVDRMDHALENLLQFTRFREPAPQRVAFGALLSPVLTELTPVLTERHVTLDYRPPSATVAVTVDPDQLGYALRNLLRSLIRNIDDGESISIGCGEAGTLTVQLPAGNGGISGKLSALLPPREADEESPLPLGLALARTLIDRNGGRMEVDDNAAAPVITVSLPSE